MRKKDPKLFQDLCIKLRTNSIMAGCGVNEKNALQIVQTGVDAIHFTIHKKQIQRNEMGVKNTIDEKKIENILKQFNS